MYIKSSEYVENHKSSICGFFEIFSLEVLLGSNVSIGRRYSYPSYYIQLEYTKVLGNIIVCFYYCCFSVLYFPYNNYFYITFGIPYHENIISVTFTQWIMYGIKDNNRLYL